ncbi:MAG: hypothetical protein QOG97_82, partial [Acidimicrobiaceae bacterium]|nr:hypothetical protein [Acidimicrobiaceae bacterium]
MGPRPFVKMYENFRSQVIRHWLASLRRRSQRHRLNWDRMNVIATRRSVSRVVPEAQC